MSGQPFSNGPGGGIVVSATASSVAGTVDCTRCNAMHIANTSATVYVGVRWGEGSQSASLTTDLIIPPLGQIVVAVSPSVTGVAAIGSAAGPSVVGFTPGNGGY